MVAIRLELLKYLGVWLAPGGRRGRLSILIYHRILPERDPMLPGEVDAATFSWHMQLLARYFKVLPFTLALRLLREGCLPARAVCVTFDDGYADNLEVALPILQAWNVPATFFIATGYLNGGRMWNDTVIEVVRCLPAGILDLSGQGLGSYHLDGWQERNNAALRLIQRLKYLPFQQRHEQVQHLASLVVTPLPDNLMLTAEQVRALQSAGMEIGAHTVNHPILAQLDHTTARWEIATSKQYLEELLGQEIKLFAYPNGKLGHDYLLAHREMVRDLGFVAAVSTHWGGIVRQTDPWQLPRFTPWDTQPDRFMARLMWNYRFGR
jgi:peptidoglycan/xylan/chitin deacetylase (PgdA/CDA1 family)